jgi:NTP pyrophosphatase (non-canonical NTP hydrolase)
MRFADLQNEAWSIAERKGFHEGRANGRDDVLVRLCLVHTEVSEAVQGVKRHWKGQGDDVTRSIVGEELADAVIRIMDLAECLGINLQGEIAAKNMKNADRPRLYGTPHAVVPAKE